MTPFAPARERNMKTEHWTLNLVFALATASAAFGGDDDVAKTRNLVDNGVVSASLRDVAERPRAFLKSRFVFEGRFDKTGDVYQPFFTPFDEQSHVNFSAWPVEADLSNKEEYADVFPLLYLDRRRGQMMERLFSLARFQRFRAIGVVESVFSDRAFVEILHIEPLDTDWMPSRHLLAAFGRQGKEGAAKSAVREESLRAEPLRDAQPEEKAPPRGEATEEPTGWERTQEAGAPGQPADG